MGQYGPILGLAGGTRFARWVRPEVDVGVLRPVLPGPGGATAGLLVPLLLRLRALVGEARADHAAAKRSSPPSAQPVPAREDQRFLTSFLKDTRALARELSGGCSPSGRSPRCLLNISPAQPRPGEGGVLVRRRRRAARRPSRRASSWPRPTRRQRDHFQRRAALDSGEIGFARRRSGCSTARISRPTPRPASSSRGPSLADAPARSHRAARVRQSTLGRNPRAEPRMAGDRRTALGLVAQTGAQVLHTAAQVRRMKTTAGARRPHPRLQQEAHDQQLTTSSTRGVRRLRPADRPGR